MSGNAATQHFPVEARSWNRDLAAEKRRDWPGFVAIDEGLDRLFRWSPDEDRFEWSVLLAHKSRTLLKAGPDLLWGASPRGYFELGTNSGEIREKTLIDSGEVFSLIRTKQGGPLLAGLNLEGQSGVCFMDFSEDLRLLRRCCLAGDYIRGSSLTEADTLLYTNNDRVIECSWEGRVLREFSAPGFYHAWKALRLKNGNTLISAGYGAFAVEFDAHARELRRWECPTWARAFVRPFFFGDFQLKEDGTLRVCNWLGHGSGLGESGCSLLEFSPEGHLTQVWQEPFRCSSVQTFVTPGD